MTRPDEIILVRTGFDLVAPMAEQVGVAVYNRLFALDPSLRLPFRGEIRAHARNLLGRARHGDALARRAFQGSRNLRALGARHVGYGVRAQHVTTGGHRLARHAHSFTPEARAPWMRAYQSVAGMMSDALPPA